MERIENTIRAVIRGLASKKADTGSAQPQQTFKKLLTKKELAHIKINNFYKGVLYVDCDSSSWLYALRLRKKAFLEELQDKSPEIKDIRFRIGELP